MALTFTPEKHEYLSIDPNDNITWISATKLVDCFKPKFDAVTQSIKSSKNKKSKWYGIPPEEIQEIWSGEGSRANTLGTFYHNQREEDLLSCDTITISGIEVPIIKPIYDGIIKHAPAQNLTEGIYPEHFVYLKSAGICGQSDRVEVIQGVVNIIDYKTNKEIKQESYTSWDGTKQKMQGPLEHIDDCNFWHYAVQLSLYLYIILKHNPTFKPGKLILHHIAFENEGLDKYGYPITKLDHQGNPIVVSVTPYEVPYLKSEVIAMINWLHDQPKLNNNGK
jgi:hypothetical protein